MLNQFIWGLQPDLARSVSLQYPKSIAQVVSLVETTELAVKASRRLATRGGGVFGFPKGSRNQNRGKGVGVVAVDRAKLGEGVGVEG